MSQIWDTLSENEQKYFLNIQAGANQSVQLGALMSNFQTAIDATNTALNSSGSAMQENEAYMESLEAKTNLLKASFQTLANDVISKELVSSFLDLGQAILSFADTGLGQYITKITLLTGIGWGFTSLAKASKVIPTIVGQVKSLGEAVQLAFGAGSGFSELGETIGAVGGLSSMALPVIAGISVAILGFVELIKYVNGEIERNNPFNQMQEAIDKFSQSTEELNKQKSIVELAEQYQDLREKIQGVAEDDERVAEWTAELDAVRQQLSLTTDGVIDAEAEYGAQLDETVNRIKAASQAEVDRINNERRQTLHENKDNYQNAKQQIDEQTEAINLLTEARARANAAIGAEDTRLDDLNAKYQSYLNWKKNDAATTAQIEAAYRDWYIQFVAVTGTMPTYGTAAGVLMNNLGEMVYAIDDAGNAWDVLNTKVSESTDKLTTANLLISETEAEVFDLVTTGVMTVAQAADVLGISTEAVERKIRGMAFAANEGAESFDNLQTSVDSQINALFTLEDELAVCTQKIADFQAATSDEKGDTLKQYADAYSKFLEAWQQGFIGSNAVSAGIELILGEDWQSRLGIDLQEAGELLAGDFFQGIFAAGGEDFGTNFIGMMAEQAVDAGNGIKELRDENDNLVASFKETADGLDILSVDWSAMADYLEVDEGLLTALADALSIFGGVTIDSAEDALNFANAIGAITESAEGAKQVNLQTLVDSLVEAGRTDAEIQAVVDNLGTIEGLTFDTPVESLGSVIEQSREAQTAAEEAEGQLEDLDSQTAKPRVDLDTSSFDRHISVVRQRLRELNNIASTISLKGLASGSSSAPGGPTLVNEEGPEIIQSGSSAYIANNGLPTIVDMEPGSRVFTAEETADILRGKKLKGTINAAATGYSTGIHIPTSALPGRATDTGTGNYQTTVTTTRSGTGGGGNATTVTASGDKSYETVLEAHKTTLSLLEAQYDLLEEQNASVDEITAKAKEIQDEYEATINDLKASPEYLADDLEALTEVVNYTKNWYEWQEKIVEDLEDVADIYATHISLLESQLDLLEAEGATQYTQIDKIKEIQASLHDEAEALRIIVNNSEALGMSTQEVEEVQTRINKLSKQWWDYQEQIANCYDEILADQQRIVDNMLEGMNNQVDAINALQTLMNDYYDGLIDDIDAQIEALNEVNDELEDQIALEEKLDAIAQSRQKKLMVYKDGRWQYITDTDAVSTATKDYKDYVRQKEFNDTVAGLEAQKDALNDLKDQWNNLDKEYNRIQNELLVAQQLGIDTTLDNWQSFVEDVSVWAQKYLDLMMSINHWENVTLSATPSGSGGQGPTTNTGPAVSYNAYDKNVDYSDLIAKSESWDEAQHWAAMRNAKITGEGLAVDVSSATLLKEWQASRYASGTTSARGGFSLVGENGAEMRILGKGDGIIPANMTKNLMAWGKFTPNQYGSQIANVSGSNRMDVTIQTLSLPNVTDGAGFVEFVKNNMFGQVLSFVH